MRIEIYGDEGDVLRVVASWTETVIRAGVDGETGESTEVEVEVERQAEAAGWVSATTNHYDPDSYDEDGHRNPKAEPRTMSIEELRAYALRLLVGQNPEAPISGLTMKPAGPVQSFEL